MGILLPGSRLLCRVGGTREAEVDTKVNEAMKMTRRRVELRVSAILRLPCGPGKVYIILRDGIVARTPRPVL